MSDRDRSQEELGRSQARRAELEDQRDALMAEAADIRQQLAWAQSRSDAVEARCEILQQALETSRNLYRHERSAGIQNSVPRIWGDVPPRNPWFMARSEALGRLDDLLGQNSGRKPSLALTGMMGSGKTQVAIEYIYQHASEYDIVWWINADEASLVRGSLATLSNRLGLDTVRAEGIDGATEAAMDALRRGEPYNRWLLIFDNAGPPEELRRYILSDAPGDILITTRDPRWQLAGEPVPVGSFSRAESLDFLRVKSRGHIDEAWMERLAYDLGDLPLALDQAVELINSGISAENYLEMLDADPASLLAEAETLDYGRPLMASWTATIAILEKRLPESVDILALLSLFGPDPVPLRIFMQQDKGDSHRLSRIFSDPILFSRVRENLRRHSLLHVDSPMKAMRLNRLVRALGRQLREEDRADFLHAAHVQLTASIAGSSAETDGCCLDIAPHLEDLKVAECEDPNVREACIHIVRCLAGSGLRAQAQTLAEQCLESWEGDLQASDSGEAGMRERLEVLLDDINLR